MWVMFVFTLDKGPLFTDTAKKTLLFLSPLKEILDSWEHELSKGDVDSAAETLVWDFYPSGMWALLNRNVYIIQYFEKKKSLRGKMCQICYCSNVWEEKAINSFESLQVNFFFFSFLHVFSMVDDVLLLK